MGLSEQLWQNSQDLALACLQHPFVQGISDGSLPRPLFADYVGQDAFFLEAFARAYSVAAAKAPDWPAFQIFHHLAGGVLAELELHQGYAQQWGVDLQAIVPNPATRRYTDFLLATAWSQEIGVTTVAMLPCMRLYSFLGQQLAADGIPQHLYQGWISTYSQPEFFQLAQQLAELADRYALDAPLVQSTYRYAMLCERDFFQAVWQNSN